MLAEGRARLPGAPFSAFCSFWSAAENTNPFLKHLQSIA
jgi:hypothetical protein